MATQVTRPGDLLKAFYENLHLVNLFPLFEVDFEIELGGEGWRKLIGKYKTYGKPQKTNIPSFKLLNTLFNPQAILAANKPLGDSRKDSYQDMSEMD